MSDHGDPACWLDRTCPRCGFLDDGPVPEACPRCGERLDDRRDTATTRDDAGESPTRGDGV